MGAIRHGAEETREIGGHKELATLQVANVQNQEIIPGMPWLKGHNPKIDWEEEKITFDSERCITWCLDKSAQCSQPSSPSVFGGGRDGLWLVVRLFGGARTEYSGEG